MAEQQQIIYVEGKGFIPIQSGQSVRDAIATAPDRGSMTAQQTTQDTFGLQLPQGEGDAADTSSFEAIFKAVPQLAGLVAQFTPAGRLGYRGAAAIPMIIETVRQAIQKAMSGEPMDTASIATQGAMGVFGQGAGNVIKGTGKLGEEKVLRSLGLSGELKNEVAEELLPKLAIREKAKMTIPGVQAIRDKATRTGSGGLEDLAEAMGDARLNSATAKNKMSVWPNEMIGNLVNVAPRQMATGSAMASPFGVDTQQTIAPAGEATIRAIMAYLSALMGKDTPAQQGPRRRNQP